MMTMTAEQIRSAMENKLEYLMEVTPQSSFIRLPHWYCAI